VGHFIEPNEPPDEKGTGEEVMVFAFLGMVVVAVVIAVWLA
jgi:hypothetical protein